MTDDPVEAWAAHLRDRWREEMRPILEAHRAELPFPEDIAEFHGFSDIHPERPFPSDRFPAPDHWMWEGEAKSRAELFEHLHDGWIPLRDFGCGEYDILVLSGVEAGRVWMLADVGVARCEPHLVGNDRKPLPWVDDCNVPAPPRRPWVRRDRVTRKLGELAREQFPDGRVMGIGSGIVRVHLRRDGLVHNVDIEPADARKAYDVRVHTFPEGRRRHVRTTAHVAVPAERLGGLLD
jgi:hypothetical protein